MLRHNSNTALQSIFSNSISHNDTCTEASKVFTFNEPRKWLLIVFCFEKTPYTNCNTWGIDKYFFHSFMTCDQYVYNFLMPHKIAMPRTMICFHIHASKFL